MDTLRVFRKHHNPNESYVRLIDFFIHNHNISTSDEKKQLNDMNIPLYFDYYYRPNKYIDETIYGTFYIVSTTKQMIKYYDPVNNKILVKRKINMSNINNVISCDYKMFNTRILNIIKKY